MQLHDLKRILADLPLGEVRYLERTGSTNDDAADWAEEGAPDLSLVLAEEQTAGRGRHNRRWYTPHGASLAFSLILRAQGENAAISRMTALGALALSDALHNLYGLRALIKWPNDVLAGGRKLAGVLAEAAWQGDRLASVILGIGINIAPLSVPPQSALNFPAVCLEKALGKKVDRLELLHEVLACLLDWRPRLEKDEFIQAWQERLAFRDEWVQIVPDRGIPSEGQVVGLDARGCLMLRTRVGDFITLQSGQIRPSGPSMGTG
jgi:BirA family biotin operon repressor/biotin-[acetyl-CoA-carboxylase] ligase